jgi:hypothetical protein
MIDLGSGPCEPACGDSDVGNKDPGDGALDANLRHRPSQAKVRSAREQLEPDASIRPLDDLASSNGRFSSR